MRNAERYPGLKAGDEVILRGSGPKGQELVTRIKRITPQQVTMLDGTRFWRHNAHGAYNAHAMMWFEPTGEQT